MAHVLDKSVSQTEKTFKAADAQVAIDMWRQFRVVSIERRRSDALSIEVARQQTRAEQLEQLVQEQQERLEEERRQREDLEERYAELERANGRIVKKSDRLAVRAGELLRVLMGEPIPLRTAFQEWHRACPRITPLTEEEKQEREVVYMKERSRRESILPSTSKTLQLHIERDVKEQAIQCDSEDAPIPEDMKWLYDALEQQRQETESARQALARAATQHAEQMALAQRRIFELEELLKAEQQRREDEMRLMQDKVRRLEAENRRLIEGDEYIVWMEGRLDTLEKENDALKQMRDTYIAQRRRVTAEKTGELCIRCARQIVWRDWVENDSQPSRPSSAGRPAGLEQGPGDGRRRAKARASRSALLPHLKAGWM